MHPFYNESLTPTAPTHIAEILAFFSPSLFTLALEAQVAFSP